MLSQEWKVIVDQVHDMPNGTIISQVIMRDPHYGRVCFKSVKTLGVLHSQL